MKQIVLILAILAIVWQTAAQVSINDDNSAPDSSAMLDVKSQTKGLLAPRVALSAINVSDPIQAPALGLLVFNTVNAGTPPNNVVPAYYRWDGAKWVLMEALQGTNFGDMQYWNGYQWIIIPIGQPGQILQISQSNIPFWSGSSYASIITFEATDITSNSALSGGRATSNGGSAITSKGLCYSTMPNPTTSSSIISTVGDTGSFVATMTGLSPGTSYYARAYAINAIGTKYGDEISFSTLPIAGDRFEYFNNYVGISGTYTDGTFLGQDGSTWSYSQCRRDRAIVDPSPCLGKGRNPTGKVVSGLIGNGCGTISFDYKQGFSSAVNLNVYVNGALVGNVTSPGGNGDTSTVRNSGPLPVNVSGSFTLLFKQADSLLSGQVTIDNITWTTFGGGPLPEPTNYPANFAGNTAPFSILLSWIDATGGQAPSSYLILASDQNNIANPVDGTPVANDPNLADGSGALNVIQGIQSVSFGNLPSNKQYFFKIFPCTNFGSLINYKTDGSAPFVSVVTSNTVIIDSVHFTNYTMGNWQAKNVIGEQVWTVDSIHGVNGSSCIKMSGFANSVSNVNEDWFISKAMNFNLYNNERLNFQSAYKYAGSALQCLISNDYDGQGNPGDFTWAPLAATWSSGNWLWTPSGDINVSSVNGPSVYIAFKYISTATESSTWLIDNIVITGIVE